MQLTAAKSGNVQKTQQSELVRLKMSIDYENFIIREEMPANEYSIENILMLLIAPERKN